MKILRLRLEQFRRFRAPVEMCFEDGINLIVGPNESGKSTLAEGLRAAFFERHGSSALTSLQPWGDDGAAPEVEVDFLWQGETWKLRKRFLKRERANLDIGSTSLGGTEAEDRLAELLGYEFPGRGASRPEQHGIPGLLWIEQGTSQALAEAAGFASDHLQAALGGALDDLASSSGDELMQRAEKERSELLTKDGKPRAAYRESLAEEKQLQTGLAALDERIEHYRQRVDELEHHLQQQREVDTTEPWREQLSLARQAEAKVQKVEALDQERQQLDAQLKHCREQSRSHRRELEQYTEEQKNLVERALARDAAESRLKVLKTRLSEVSEELLAARQAFDRAAEQRKQAENKNEHEGLTTRKRELQEQVDQHREALRSARELTQTLRRQKETLQGLQVDEQTLTALRACEEKLREGRIRQQTLATRLGWQLDPGQHITLGSEERTGTGEVLLLEQTELLLPGLGRLQLQPGGVDVASLAREQQSLNTERERLLNRLGLVDLAAAEERSNQAARLENDIRLTQRELDTRAPQGLEQIETALVLAGNQLQELDDRLARLPPPAPDVPPIAEARDAEDQAGATLDQLERQRVTLNEERASAGTSQEIAEREWQQLNARISSAERIQRQNAIEKALTDLAADEQAFTRRLQKVEETIAAAQPDILRQDIERHRKSAERQRKEADDRRVRISELRGQLGESGNLNLEEQAAEISQTLERTRRRNRQLAGRAAALDLLLELLRAKRQELTDRLLAPIQSRLEHYLRLLHPETRLNIDENLVPRRFQRPGRDGPEQDQLDALSFGMREQIGVIGRLAYADLLREAGKPTLLILDDALVHTDEERLQQMKRILFDAGQRHQILIFSCHAHDWTDLGVTPVNLLTLKAGA